MFSRLPYTKSVEKSNPTLTSDGGMLSLSHPVLEMIMLTATICSTAGELDSDQLPNKVLSFCMANFHHLLIFMTVTEDFGSL